MWVYLPSMCWPSAQDMADSNWDFDSQLETVASSLVLNTKPMPVKSWRLAWKRKNWIKRLCGRMLSPLTADRGVELWIASLADTLPTPSAGEAAGPGKNN